MQVNIPMIATGREEWETIEKFEISQLRLRKLTNILSPNQVLNITPVVILYGH